MIPFQFVRPIPDVPRDSVLGEMSNWLHPSVPISQDEDKDNR